MSARENQPEQMENGRSKYWELHKASQELHQNYRNLDPLTILHLRAETLWEEMNSVCEKVDNGEKIKTEIFDELIGRSKELCKTIKHEQFFKQ